ncbi:hypothetical protein B7C51_24685 (plasmid) [Paenibacillus larvae subsp. pulvifaciens]|uniref:Uncharacterized protein n=1 Tax=Paenibacillus larvae subsp. pulvifaciens TaxID=1477 RepID=A0A1V0UZP9_9BACL|nr:DHH family phosphoesterase [Paenibacillus larvae]ARF70674.1 hypothetical protein B7C51_24685 [Paenibacillus larvae subsp. pulvifaciens]
MGVWREKKPIIEYEYDDDILTKLLKIRGIENVEEFLHPNASVLYDPYLLSNIENASNIIIKHVMNKSKICISMDPDSDGILSTAIMKRYLSNFSDNIYISYNQRNMGHGVEHQMDMITDDTDLIIILDSSTNSIDACKELKEKGIEIVIIDHHDYEKSNSYAVIVNPKLDNYPNKNLSGTGVVYKTLQVIDDTLQTGNIDHFIDMVSCGMYADMMPVDILENRYIIIKGMDNIRNTGLKSILEYNKIDPNNINSQTLGFTIGPLLNGVARLEKIELAIELLLCDDFDRCLELVEIMTELNNQRKKKETDLFNSYSKKVNHNDKILVAIDSNASKGFNGLVANKLAQEYKKPSLVMRDYNDELVGSFRSIANFPLRTFLNQKKVRKLLKYAVGHEFAGGIALNKDNLNDFLNISNHLLSENDFNTEIYYDLSISADQISINFVNQVEKFDFLTGVGFPAATFLINDLIVEDKKILGSNRDTVKISCEDVVAIKFKVNEKWGSDIEELSRLEVIGQLKNNIWKKWRGQIEVTPQVVLSDYKVL